MSIGLAGLYEEIGQALTALRANAAFLLRKSGGQADLQAAARDVETQGAAIDRRRADAVLARPKGWAELTGTSWLIPTRGAPFEP